VSLHPYMGQRLVKDRHREMLAQAAEQRRARQPVGLAMASRRAKRAGRLRQAVLNALSLRTGFPQ
jgi:hypothetical protein